MQGQFAGRFQQDTVDDQNGEKHRIFATVNSGVWMQRWSFKLRGGNRVLVAVRVSGDEFIVTGKRGCHCVYLSAGNRKAQTREDGQSFYLLGVMPAYNRELTVWAEHTTHNKAACGRRMREMGAIHGAYASISIQGLAISWSQPTVLAVVCAEHVCSRSRRF